MGYIRLSPRKVTLGTFAADPRARELIGEVLDSEWISYGPMSRRFETEFAKIHQRRYAILSNSGTSSLHVALQALKELHGWEDGAKVLVPATTFIATANIVIHNRMEPVLVDIERDTYNMDPGKLEAALEKINKKPGLDHPYGVKCVIPVHLFGQMANMTEIDYLCGKYDVKMIEDSCETMFVAHYGRPCGSWGDIGCFSTYNAHLITTGVGGLAITDSPDLAAKMRSLVNHGLEIEHLNPDENFAPQPAPNRQFSFGSIGHSFRITELEAALGVAQLEKWHYILRIRNRNANHIGAGLKIINRWAGPTFKIPEVMEGNGHAWMMYPIISLRIPKPVIMRALAEAQIETRDMLPLIPQPAYRDIGWENYPVSRWVYEQGFYVGCHQDLEPEDIQYVVQTLSETVETWEASYESPALADA